MDQRQLTAYHEAGHEMAADELGVVTAGIVSIVPNPDDETLGRMASEVQTFPWKSGYSPEEDAAFREVMFHDAVINYAGHAALVALLGAEDMSEDCAARHGAGQDWANAEKALGGDAARMESAKARAIDIVKARRVHIEHLARMLCDGNGTVDMNDFWKARRMIEGPPKMRFTIPPL